MDAAPNALRPVRPPPVLWPAPRRCVWISRDGEIEEIGRREAAARARAEPPLVCHARSAARRLGCEPFPARDVLELFAFVHPARFVPPTPRGLAEFLDLDPPEGRVGEALVLPRAAAALLDDLAARSDDRDAAPVLLAMRDCGWPWAEAALAALGIAEPAAPGPVRSGGLAAWRRLAEWAEHPPEPPPGSAPVESGEARARLARLLGAGAEARPSQADYASAVAAAFRPRENPDEPMVVLAEAGTGVGKTLGYVAPASLWAEKNGAAVWISTYTRNLQRQIDGELDRLYPDPAAKARKAVVRKGRENYLCLLNLEDAARALPAAPGGGAALGLVARWAAATRDGDLAGGDFPAWLPGLLGRGRTLGLADRRGECVHSACPHYRKCFVEKSVRSARRADLVIANHALTMVQAALAGPGGGGGAPPTRYVFDEGHHVFDAADGAFSARLSGVETAELRRWLDGSGARRPARARGLRRRIEDLVAGEAEAEEALGRVLAAARALPEEGWTVRLAEGRPRGPAEAFLEPVRRQVLARDPAADGPYSLEADAKPPVDGLLGAAAALDAALGELLRPMEALRDALAAMLDDGARTLESPTRLRIEAAVRSLDRRGAPMVGAWRAMLRSLAGETPPEFVDWFEIERIEGRDADVGMRRHWIDPTAPLHEAVVRPAHGVVVTSATLRDVSGDGEADWRAAEARAGAARLPRPALRAAVPSPFDYAGQTRVFVVRDVNRGDPDRVAAAYRELFLAAGGGALGLFTAIRRLRETHRRVVGPLDDAGLALYAQHVDGIDLAALVDIFRAEEDSCLFGTDAARDGVDVPGRSLRLIVFDRTPWPRPDILHRARREAFGGAAYTDMLTRLKLKQAFGRLVRRADDRGVFAMLDPGTPTRLLGAFPEAAPVARVGLAEAIAQTRAFLSAA